MMQDLRRHEPYIRELFQGRSIAEIVTLTAGFALAVIMAGC